MSCRDAREYLALEQSGETLNEYQQALLLDDYWMMRGLDYSEVILTEKDREYIRPYVEATPEQSGRPLYVYRRRREKIRG